MTPAPKPIFISYSSKHRNLTLELTAALEAQYGAGSVWWDYALESWGDYEIQIRNALHEAEAVVVIWSKAAGESDWVKSEAGRANRQSKLINVRPKDTVIDDVPSPYDQHHINALEDTAGILKSVASILNKTFQKTAIPLHEIYFRQHGLRVLDPKRTALPSDQAKISPAMLLQAKYEAVAFSDGTGSCADMLAWATDGTRAGAGRLIHGAGGFGKTRLLIETAARLGEQGWMAGFLARPPTDAAAAKQGWQALEQLIHHGDGNGLLIVIDYAEGRKDEVTQLSTAILGAAPQATRPIRLVALARSAGEWWPTLIEEQGDVLRLFHRAGGETDVIALPGLDTSEGRLAFYRHCEAGLAGKFTGKKQSPPRERLDRIAEGTHYDRPLAIQMEALLHLTGATPDLPGIDKQLDNVLGLERAHWVKLCGALDDDAKRDMARGAAQVTMVNGVSSRSSAERLLMADGFYAGARTTPMHVDPVYRRLAAVYGAKDGALLALEPDNIGEHHVAATADDRLIDGCLAWIDAEPEETREERRRALLTVLQRATRAEHGAKADKAVALLDHMVQTALAPLAADMVAVMVDTPGRLEAVLRARITGSEDFDALAVLHNALPLRSLSLMDLSLAVAEQLATVMRRQVASTDAMCEQDDDATLAPLGRLSAILNTLGNCRSALGRRVEALAAAGEAVGLYRHLAEARPDAFLPYLATSLNNLGMTLSNLGRPVEALAATVEAVNIRQRLAEDRPGAFLPDLATSLNNLGSDLCDVGRREEALAATVEAVDIRRRLADARPDAFLPDLATSLNNLGGMLSALGLWEEALAATVEAVDIRRRLADARPDAFLPNLAGSLNNLGMMLSNLGRRVEALVATKEAVDIRRRLAEARPDAFLPDLAMSLGAMGNAHLIAEQFDMAAAAFEEGLTVIAPFVERHSQAFGDLARGLGQYYLQACEKAGRAPDAALLERVARALGGGGAADASPSIDDQTSREVMAQANSDIAPQPK